MENNNYMSTWKKSCIRIGSPTNILAAFTAFIPVLYLCNKFDCWPETSLILSAWALTAIAFGAFYIVEPIAYYASLGMAGTYLSFLSGNIGNMRMPCASLALDVTESEPGTIQAEVVSTMAICGSIITNLIATTAAAFVGTAIVAILPQAINDGLKLYASAAIFGATFGNYALKKPKIAVFGALIPIVCKLIGTLPAWLTIVLSVFGTVLIARLMFNAEQKKKA
ncbi:MAG: hypothetical protein K6F56_07330 [Oscillospiraceae bacterium]|nr:hypothetical protein [Oscillospiraceae bacterium]